METSRELLVKLTTDATQAVRELKRTGDAAEDVQKRVGAMSNALKAGIAAIGVGAGIQKVIGEFNKARESIEEIYNSSLKLGLSSDEFQKLSFAAKQSGLGVNELALAMRGLERNLLNVDTSTTGAARALRALGVSGADSPEEAIRKISDAFRGSTDEMGKAALAAQLFGAKAGPAMVQMLNEGGEGIENLKNRAVELGLVLDKDGIAKIKAFNDKLGEMQAASDAMKQNITIGLVPAIHTLAEAFTGAAKDGNHWQEIGKQIGAGLIWIAQRAIEAATVVKALGAAIALVAKSANEWFSFQIKDSAKTLLEIPSEVGRIAKEGATQVARLEASYNKFLQGSTSEGSKAAVQTNRVSNAISALGKEAKGGAEKLSDYQKELLRLNKAMEEAKLSFANNGEKLGEYQKLMAESAAGTKKFTASELEKLGTLARAVDAQVKLNEQTKEYAATLQAAENAALKAQFEGPYKKQLDLVDEFIIKISDASSKESKWADDKKQKILDELRARQEIIDAVKKEQELKAQIAEREKQAANAQLEVNAQLNKLTLEGLDKRKLNLMDEFILKLMDARSEESKWSEEQKIAHANFLQMKQSEIDAIIKQQEAHAKAKKDMQDYSELAEKYTRGIGDAMLGAINGTESFGSAFRKLTAQVLNDLARMIIQKQVFDKIFSNNSSSGGGWLGGLISGAGSWLSNLFKFNAMGNAFSGGTGLPYGVYDKPTFFPIAGSNRLIPFAKGGVLGEASPEAIMPLRRDSSGRLGVESSPVNVNIINNAGVKVTSERDGDDINITIEKVRAALTRDIRSGGNAFAAAFQGTYGLNRGAA